MTGNHLSHLCILSLALALALLRSPAGQAQEVARVRANVSEGVSNMRTGPGQDHALVVAVPAGSVVALKGGCRPPDDGKSRNLWCFYAWGRYEGWMSSGNVAMEVVASGGSADPTTDKAPGFECTIRRGSRNQRAVGKTSGRLIAELRSGDRVYAVQQALGSLFPLFVTSNNKFIAVDGIDFDTVDCQSSGKDAVYPIVFKGKAGRRQLLSEFGLLPSPVVVDEERTTLRQQRHKCFYIGDGHMDLELSEEVYDAHRRLGFDFITMCMALTSGQIRFDPENGARIPTYVLADTFGDGPASLSDELPFYAPPCFSRGVTRVNRAGNEAETNPVGCRINYHPWSGRRLSGPEVEAFTRQASLQAEGGAGEALEDSNNLARDPSREASAAKLQAIKLQRPR